MVRPRSSRGCALRTVALLLLALLELVGARGAEAQRLGARFSMGREVPGDDFGGFLEPDVFAEGTLFLRVGAVRFGAGAGWVSYRLDGPYVQEFLQSARGFFGVGSSFAIVGPLHGSLEVRATFRSFRTHKPHTNRELTDDERAEEIAFAGAGDGGDVLGGLEVQLWTMRLEIGGRWGAFAARGVERPDAPDPTFGTVWGWHAGILWYP